MGRKVRGLQSAWTHAKCADPRKVRGPMQSMRAAFWVRGALSAQIRAKCVGRGSITWAALSAWAAIARSGEWAALSTHLPRTCHAMPTQCNHGSTHVGRNEPQSSGTLRVKIADVPVSSRWGHLRVKVSQITGNTTVCSTLSLGYNQRKYFIALLHKPLLSGVPTGDWWFPLIKGQ